MVEEEGRIRMTRTRQPGRGLGNTGSEISLVLKDWNAQETHLYQIKNICEQSVLILNEIQVVKGRFYMKITT